MNFDQKILIVRFSSVGDIVQSTSPLKTIRNAFPDSQITYLTLNEYAPLLEMHPDIDFLISIKRHHSFNKLLDLRNQVYDKLLDTSLFDVKKFSTNFYESIQKLYKDKFN